MQLVKGNFVSCQTNYLRKLGILTKHEICIYDKETNNDKLYARSYEWGETSIPKDEFDIVRVPLKGINDRELFVKHDRVNKKVIFPDDF